jgi:PKD repeat protein
MKKSIFLSLLGVGITSIMLFSCKKDTPAPTADFFFTISNYQVTFTPQVTNTDTYSWNFGDGSAVSTEANPVHTYESFGDYSVVLTVTGGGGTVTTTKVVNIAATSLKDLLTGGKNATAGKTWVMSTSYNPGKDGGGPITTDMPVVQPSLDNVLNMFGLGDEYDNEFTFFYDGTYGINLKNGHALAGAVYGAVMGTMVGDPAYAIGMCAASYTVPASSTWALHTEDLTVDAITDPNTEDVPPVHGNVTFTGKNWISFSTGAYFGILDFPTTEKIIVKEISSDKMNVAMFLCGYGYGADPNMMMLPTNFIHMTYVVKK